MSEPTRSDHQPAPQGDPNSPRDHLANERTFLAWVRTGVALIVFGFAIGRFTIMMRQVMGVQRPIASPGGLSSWFGALAIIAGVLLTSVGLLRYRQTRAQLESGKFEPAGFVIDLVGILTALFGLVLAGYLIYSKARPQRQAPVPFTDIFSKEASTKTGGLFATSVRRSILVAGT